MESIVTIIMVGFVIALVWAVFFYITGIQKDRKILDDYITAKHRRKHKLKKSESTA